MSKTQLMKKINKYLNSDIFPDEFVRVHRNSFKFEHTEKDLGKILKMLKEQAALVKKYKNF